MSDWERAPHAHCTAHSQHLPSFLLILFCLSFSFSPGVKPGRKQEQSPAAVWDENYINVPQAHGDGDDEAKHKWGEATTRAWFPIHGCLSVAQPQHHHCFKHKVFLGMVNFINFRMVHILIFSDSRDNIEMYGSYPPLPITSPTATPPLFQEYNFPWKDEFH